LRPFLVCFGELIADSFPVSRNNSGSSPGGFEIWLIKHREDPMAIVSLKLSIDILLLLCLASISYAIGLICERVQAATIFAVLVIETDLDLHLCEK
jgi:hypothetical protein